MKFLCAIVIVMIVTMVPVLPVYADNIVHQGCLDGYLVLVEIISVDPFEPAPDSFYSGDPTVKYVYKPIGRILEVYSGPDTLLGKDLNLASPLVGMRKPDDLIHMYLNYDGVHPEAQSPVGAHAVIAVMSAKDLDSNNIMTLSRNAFGFPYRSVFFRSHPSANNIFYHRQYPEVVTAAKKWGAIVKGFNETANKADRISYLKRMIHNELPIVAVTGVHLIMRQYPNEASKYFDDIILREDTPFLARLAIDHEFCIARGQEWVKGGQIKLSELLAKEAEGNDVRLELLYFRNEMIFEYGSWSSRARRSPEHP